MYRVYYYLNFTNFVSHRNFDTLREATEFAVKQPKESVLEIKHYENSLDNGPTFWSKE
jgi:hypothetical protein